MKDLWSSMRCLTPCLDWSALCSWYLEAWTTMRQCWWCGWWPPWCPVSSMCGWWWPMTGLTSRTGLPSPTSSSTSWSSSLWPHSFQRLPHGGETQSQPSANHTLVNRIEKDHGLTTYFRTIYNSTKRSDQPNLHSPVSQSCSGDYNPNSLSSLQSRNTRTPDCTGGEDNLFLPAFVNSCLLTTLFKPQ